MNIIKAFMEKTKGNMTVVNKIHNFEKDLMPKLCDDCKKKMCVCVNRNFNCLKKVSQKNYFCPVCNDIIAKEAVEIFIKI